MIPFLLVIVLIVVVGATLAEGGIARLREVQERFE